MAIPEWAKAMRLPHTEIKEFNGYYYLYEVYCKYDKETKKRKKTKPIYLGRLIEGVGLVKKNERIPTKNIPIQPTNNVEYGVSATLETLMLEQISALKQCYPEYWRTILGIAYCRLVWQCPIKDMDEHWLRSYLSYAIPGTCMSSDYISKMIREIGKDRNSINTYFDSFKTIGDVIAIDGTDEETSSAKISDARLSKTKRGSFGMVLNIMMIFSVGINKPMYYRIQRGNIKDVKSFILCLREFAGNDLSHIILIVDKGFYSKENIKELDSLKVQYIMPLKRDCAFIDYSNAGFDYPVDGCEAFQYHGRSIFSYSTDIDKEHKIYLCIDNSAREVESKDFTKRVYENLSKDEKYRDDIHTWEVFKERRPKMGTMAFITNSSMMMDKIDRNGKEVKDVKGDTIRIPATGAFVYKQYKRRDLIEKEIDIFKNVLDADRTYMQDRDAVEGWMFSNFVALQWYYQILNKLDSTKLDSSYSVKTVIDLMQDVRKVMIDGEWYSDCLTRKESKAVAAMGLDLRKNFCIP